MGLFMRTESKDKKLSAGAWLVALGTVGLIALSPVSANAEPVVNRPVQNAIPTPPSPPAPSVANSVAPSPVAVASPAASAPAPEPTSVRPVANAAPGAANTPLPIPMPPRPADKIGGTLSSAENSVPDSVKSVIKHLDSSVEDVTIEDLNGARQAIAKVEVLIELEKKLGELQKARTDRDGRSGLAGAIPASALNGGGQIGLDAMPATLDIVRIVGNTGHYKAMVRSMDGMAKTMEVGDRMSDGSTITAITSTGVTLNNGGTVRLVRIKNVDKVFSGTP